MKGQLASCGLALLYLSGCNSPQEDKQERKPLGAAPEAMAGYEPEYSGRLYTGGLSPEEVEKLKLDWPVYQVTGSESYFFSAPDTLQNYVGSCIGLTAEVKEGWEGNNEYINEQTTYNRSALEVTAIDLLPYSACTEPEVPEGDQAASGNLSTFRGNLRRMVRPAPDIAYDYALLLEEPYRDESHPKEPGKLVAELPLVVFRPDKLDKLEEALANDKTVVVEAARVTGYAESTVLRVVEIRQPEVEKREINTSER